MPLSHLLVRLMAIYRAVVTFADLSFQYRTLVINRDRWSQRLLFTFDGGTIPCRRCHTVSLRTRVNTHFAPCAGTLRLDVRWIDFPEPANLFVFDPGSLKARPENSVVSLRRG